MNREYLVQTLELIKPALATNDTIPIFNCFCFRNGSVTGFNDSLAIIGPTELDSTFGIHGNTLLGLLSTSSVEVIELNIDDKDASLEMGKATSTLPIWNESDFIFEAPEDEWSNKIPLTQSFMEALELALETVSKDETQPKLQGVTLVKDKMFSCNGDTITRIQVKAQIKGQVLLPTAFCESLTNLWSKLTMTKGELQFSDKWAYARFNDWSIYGNLLAIDSPINFDDLIKSTMKEKSSPLPIPEGMAEALERAVVLTNKETKRTQVNISKGKIHMITSTHMGDVDDFLIMKGHPDIRLSVSAAHLQNAIKHCDTVVFHENCTVFEKGENILMLVSNME